MSTDVDAATRAQFTQRAATYTGGGDESLRAMLELAAVEAGQRVLDVATGTGLVLFKLAEKVGRSGLAIGADFTTAMLEQAASRAGADASAPRALVAADATRLPFRAESFDVVTCRFSVHHMSDPVAGLAAMAAVLRSGGRLVIADFVRPADAVEGERHDRIERLRGHPHVRIYEQRQLEQMLADVGCPVQDVRLTERSDQPENWLASPNVAPENKVALTALLDEIKAHGAGAGFDVRRPSITGEHAGIQFVRRDAVLLAIKQPQRRAGSAWLG